MAMYPGQASIHSSIDFGFTDPVEGDLEEVPTIDRIELASKPYKVVGEYSHRNR